MDAPPGMNGSCRLALLTRWPTPPGRPREAPRLHCPAASDPPGKVPPVPVPVPVPVPERRPAPGGAPMEMRTPCSYGARAVVGRCVGLSSIPDPQRLLHGPDQTVGGEGFAEQGDVDLAVE